MNSRYHVSYHKSFFLLVGGTRIYKIDVATTQPRLEEPPDGADAVRGSDEGGNFSITFQEKADASRSDSVIDGSRRRPVLGVLNIAGADAEREGDEGRNFFITFQG